MSQRPRSPDGYYEWHEETRQWMPVAPPEQPPGPGKPKDRRLLLLIVGIIGASFVLLLIGTAISSGNSKPQPTAAPQLFDPNAKRSPDPTQVPVAAATPAPKTPGPTAAATAAPAPAAPKAILPRFQGNGIKTTTPFSAPGQWKLSYSYDCSHAGGQGNFQVMVYQGSSLIDIAVNELGAGGTSSTTIYHGGSNLHLSMNSECDWWVQGDGS